MRAMLLTIGSRGDFEPVLGLAVGLRNAGYEVTIAAAPEFETFVRNEDLDFALINMSYYKYLRTEEGRAAVGGSDRKAIKKLKKTFYDSYQAMLSGAWEAAQKTDFIIYNLACFPICYIAEKLNIPAIGFTAGPFAVPTRTVPFIGVTMKNLGGFLNHLSYSALRAFMLPHYLQVARWVRQELKMRPRLPLQDYFTIHDRPLPIVHFWSEYMLPRPPDWHDHYGVTGYWQVNEDRHWQTPAGLEDFLAQGEPPVYIGFGSMPTLDPEATTRLLLSALQQTGQRGILCGGWGGLAHLDLPDTVHHVDFVPHSWLFPRVKAVVHHGGLGSTWKGLRYGKPTVICPVAGDQPFWGKIVHDLGVGPYPLPKRQITLHQLATAIQTAVTDTPMQQRAQALGKALSQEDGVANAVRFIQKQLAQW